MFWCTIYLLCSCFTPLTTCQCAYHDPRGGEASCEQPDSQRCVMGRVSPVLVCWQWSLPGLFAHGFWRRNRIRVAKPHSFWWRSEHRHLRSTANDLVQGQSARVVQGSPVRAHLCRHHHRYKVPNRPLTLSFTWFLLLLAWTVAALQQLSNFRPLSWFKVLRALLQSFLFPALSMDKLATKIEKNIYITADSFVWH